MTLTPQQVAEIGPEKDSAERKLYQQRERLVPLSATASHPKAAEYLLHGVGRRLTLIARGINRIFELFPPAQVEPLALPVLDDATLMLHAVLINVWGTMDDLCWVYVWEHGLDTEYSLKKSHVSFLDRRFRKILPTEISSLMGNAAFSHWSTRYLQQYRDNLAHRIPPFIPPASRNIEQHEQYARLQEAETEARARGEVAVAQQLATEKRRLGSAMPVFLHAIDDASETVLLHFQLVQDAIALSEFIEIFLNSWKMPPRTPMPALSE